MKRVIVFGGTGHIGQGIVKKLLENNIEVTFTYFQNFTKALELEALGARKIQFEISPGHDFSEIFNLNIKYDGAIYAIGIDPREIFSKPRSIEKNYPLIFEMPSGLREKLININILGPYNFLEFISQNSTADTNVLFINTLDGVKTIPSPVFFSQCRASYKGLVESSSKELGQYGIKVNQVNIGLVESQTADLLSDSLKAKYLKYCSMNRAASAGEIASFAVWFVLNNTYVTGQSIILDGAI